MAALAFELESQTPTNYQSENLRSIMQGVSPLFNNPSRTSAKQLRRSFADSSNSYNATTQLLSAVKTKFPEHENSFRALQQSCLKINEIVQVLNLEGRMGHSIDQIYKPLANWFRNEIETIVSDSELKNLVGEKPLKGLVYGLCGISQFEKANPQLANPHHNVQKISSDVTIDALVPQLNSINKKREPGFRNDRADEFVALVEQTFKSPVAARELEAA